VWIDPVAKKIWIVGLGLHWRKRPFKTWIQVVRSTRGPCEANLQMVPRKKSRGGAFEKGHRARVRVGEGREWIGRGRQENGVGRYYS